MSSVVQAVIQHNLSPEQIMLLPEIFNKANFIDKEDSLRWDGTKIDIDFLQQYWKKTSEDFISRPWSEEDLALLQNDKVSFHFYQPNLVSFDTHLKASIYKSNTETKSQFDLLVKTVALIMDAVDIIIIENWYHDEAFDSDNAFTVEIIRTKVKSRNLPFWGIDL